MLKATAGGGGRGIRVITSEDDLVDAYERTRDEAARAFGSGVVFLERLVTGARHVEVQVIADGQGTAWALGRARLLGPAPQPEGHRGVGLAGARPPSRPQELKASAERLALAVGYRGAGTVEFLYHPQERTFAFLEVNTRLQVEHPITEAHHRRRPGQGPDPRRGRRPARGRPAARDRPRRRGAAQRRGPRPRLRARAGADRAARAAGRPGHPGRHRRQRGRHHPRRLRLDDRQDHRLRPHPRRGAGPAAPRAGRDDGGHRGRRDQQELRARPARPARGHRRQRRHRLDRPGPRARAARTPTGTPGSRWSPPRSRPTRRRSRSSASGCSRRRTAAVRRPGTRSAARST